MLESKMTKYVVVGSEEKPRTSLNEGILLGTVSRLEDLKFFVGLSGIRISSEEIARVEFETVASILSLCLAKGAAIEVTKPSSEMKDQFQFAFYKIIRVPGFKFVKEEVEKITGVYQGETVWPKIEKKPKRYILADKVWSLFEKNAPLLKLLKYLYRNVLKLKVRLS
jgi:hypothetical protein